MAYLNHFNPEKVDSIPAARQQFRLLKEAIDNGEIGGGGGGAVDSVNGKTGVVVLDAEDVGAAPQSTTYNKTEVDAALGTKQNKLVSGTNIATINGSDITQGGNISIVAVEGQTITIDAVPTRGSNNAVSSDGVANIIADTELVSIPFDGGNYYINANTGAITSYWANRITKPIPVEAGDEFYYTGTPSTVSLGVAAYKYENDVYTYITKLVPKSQSMVNDVYIVIPENMGITHIYAVTGASSVDNSYFKKVIRSPLSELTESLGNIGKTSSLTGYTVGHYVHINGTWQASNSFLYKFVDVVAGDIISLHELVIQNTNVAALSKKVTDTSFVPLVTFDTAGSKTFDYTAQENMTICICGSYAPRMTLVKSNKIKYFDTSINTLNTKQVGLEETNNWIEEREISLGYLFDDIAGIGDSMLCGTLDGGSLGTHDSFGASWLSFLAKRWGCERKHYSQGGTAAYNWLNNSVYGLGLMLADNKVYNAYFIAYGHNDTASVGAATDTAAPVTISGTTPSCPSGYSFCAYYKAIIDQIRTLAPHAMIFCLSEYDDVIKNSKPTYSQAVKDIAALYYTNGDHLVFNLNTGGVPISNMGLSTHYSTIGYAYIAKRVNDEVNRVVYEHRSDVEVKYFGGFNLPSVR